MNVNIRMFDRTCLVGLLVLTLGGGCGLARSAKARTQKRGRMVSARHTYLIELREAQSVNREIDAGLQANRATLTSLQERLDHSISIGEFIGDLEKLALKRGVGVDRVQPGQEQTEFGCRKTSVSFNCHGAFKDLHATLCALAHMPYLVRVENVGMDRNALSGDCVMDVTCCVYGRQNGSMVVQ